MSHTLITLSLPPDTKYFPFGETAQASTSSKWPLWRLLNFSPLNTNFFYDSRSPIHTQFQNHKDTYIWGGNNLLSQWWLTNCQASTTYKWLLACAPSWTLYHVGSRAQSLPPTGYCHKTGLLTYRTTCSSAPASVTSFALSADHHQHLQCPSRSKSWLAGSRRNLFSLPMRIP